VIRAAGPPLLELSRVDVIRAGRRALDSVSLRVERGERVAIVGPNGCGKSTLLKLLTRELYPVKAPGSFVHILGRELWNVAELRRTLGIVTNDLGAALAGAGLALDVVVSGFFASYGLSANHAADEPMRERAREALRALDIAGLAERPVDELSSGQARRVLIARALVAEPASLVFDEPASALDLHARRDLFATMRRLTQLGRGLIIATHDFGEIVPEIERVILLRDGRVFGDGPRADMLAPGRLSALFNVPVERCERCGTIDFRREP
jgi:iron complex transport system ATP-binding protein